MEDSPKNPAKGILKSSSSFDKHDRAAKRNRNAKWDEMNILETYHPANKDYGHMKVEEPKTPYNWDSHQEDEVDSSKKELDPDLLNAKLNSVAGCSRRRSTSSVSEEESDDDDEKNLDDAERARRREFKNRRKMHYNEFKAVQLAKKLMEEEDGDDEENGLSCRSVEQDEELVLHMRQMPKTPIKTLACSKSILNSAQRRRSLFRPSSPASSESSSGLGHMSPLSSSLESLQSIDSPSFSPNGHYACETPLKSDRTPSRPITVRSSLFPALTKSSPLRRSPRSSNTAKASPSIRRSIALLQDIVETSSSQTTPRSSRASRPNVGETTSTPSSVRTPPSQKISDTPRIAVIPASPTVISSVIKTVSSVNFYGAPKLSQTKEPQPESVSPENFYAPVPPRRSFVIDTLKERGRRIRRDSEASNRTFVLGSKRPRSSSRSTSRSGKRHKGMVPGVWHGIKKPKKLKKSAPKPNPTISPEARMEMLKDKNIKRLKSSKSKPRKRNIERDFAEDESCIIDTFPEPRIKRKKLPAAPIVEPQPDSSKKFFKLGAYRNATFKLNNLKLELNHGKVRVKTPEKRRALRTKKIPEAVLDPVDFSLPEPETADIQNNVDDILNQLNDGITESNTHQPIQGDKFSDEQLLNILDSPSTKVTFINTTPRKMLTEIKSSPQRSLLTNLSNLALNDNQESDKLALSATAGLLSAANNVLNCEQFANEDQENVSASKLFPVFDSKTWKAASVLADLSNVKKIMPKKKLLVPDDQYLLDAGQTSVGVVCCKECGVMYQAGDYLDEIAHNNVHNNLPQLSFLGWKDERVVSKYKDGRIVLVTPSDPKPWQEKVRKVIGVVDVELGFSENTLNWTSDKKAFLFICEKLKQVVGCLVAESCSAGFRMYPSIEGVEMDTCERDSTPCKVGINRIWTAVHRRRQGVASRLFHALRRLSGDIPADDVAFSIPSPDGKQLARALFGRQDFKVYGFISV